MKRAALFWLLALAASAPAEKLEFDVKASKPAKVTLDSPVDESNLHDPHGYFPGVRNGVFQRRIELTNTGDTPLVGRLLVVNGRDWTDSRSLAKDLSLKGPAASIVERLYMFWKDHRFHIGTGQKLASEPFAALNFWGYTLCGEDTEGLLRLFEDLKVPGRHIQLNGHVAAEYFYDDAWHVVDGDQNACYLLWDNRTLASADDLRADPLLAFRTKALGKYSVHDPVTAAVNTSLFEHVAPLPPSATEKKGGASPLGDLILLPGEALVWHCAEIPERVIAPPDGATKEAILSSTLATLEYRVSVAGQPSDKGLLRMQTVFPVVKTVNHSTGETRWPDPKAPSFKAEIAVRSKQDEVSIFCQCTQFARPLLSKGANLVTLVTNDKQGKAHVTVEYDAQPQAHLPAVRVNNPSPRFTGTPSFTIGAATGVDRLWWQISADRDFTFTAPNFDACVPLAASVKLDALSDTFLNPEQPYFFRVKARQGGIWGNWSDPFEFQVEKPPQPEAPTFTPSENGRVRLTWNPAPPAGVEYLVFGSNRLDFVPEIFSATEIISCDRFKVTASRPNKNLLGTTSSASMELVPQHRFYRVIAQKAGVRSIPSALARLPEPLAAKLPPATILQSRATRVKDKKGKETDRYLAQEEKLPPLK